jgi:outer membrane protein assembly factor BamB
VRRAALVVAVLATVATSARAATPSTTTLRGDPTHDNRVTGAPEPPLGVHWAVQLGAAISYPVIADGMVFVTTRPGADAPYGTEVHALDLATGQQRWWRPESGTYWWSALAYDQGRLALVNFDGRVTGIDAKTGATLWTTQLDQYDFSTPPVAYDGHAYLTGAGSGFTLYSLRMSDGHVDWHSDLPSGPGSPAVDASRVYVSMVCAHAEAFDRASGALLWEHHGSCEGGGEATAALHGGRMYPLGDNGEIYDAASGAVAGAENFHGAVSFADGTGYVPWFNGVIAVDAATWNPRWQVTRDPDHAINQEAPLVSGGHLYVGSESGYVSALSRATGEVAWCASTAGQPVYAGSGNVSGPDSGLGAGGGTLVVPAGGFLVAYGPGGAPAAPCDAAAATTGSSAAPAQAQTQGPALTLRAARAEVLAGHRVSLSGRLSQVGASVGGATVDVQADPWPFDDHWVHRRNAVTAADGTFALRVRPMRNTRYRALAAGLTSVADTVYADFKLRFRRTNLPGRRFHETMLLSGPRGARLRARRAHFYIVRAGTRTARLRASTRLRHLGGSRYRAAATLRYLASRRKTVVLACYREPTPDPYGRPDPLDPFCGRRRLTLPAPAPAISAAVALHRPAVRAARARFTARG